jgi:hypothetical protein
MYVRRACVVVASMLLGAAIACGTGAAGPASAIRRCAPPRGPGDTAIHSKSLRVRNVSCRVGRKVALACRRFTYGHSGVCVAVGYRWRCTSTKPPGSESAQRCVAGQKLMSIVWLD